MFKSLGHESAWYSVNQLFRPFIFKNRRMSDVTEILAQIDLGDPNAADKLLPLVYDELRKLAAARMARATPGQTLQATALVHEAYVRLLGTPNSTPEPLDPERGPPASNDDGSSRAGGKDSVAPRVWRNRGHFFAAAADAMRHILVDNARRKAAEKHGGDRRRRPLVDVASTDAMSPLELLALDEALVRLAQAYPQHAKLVELQFFAGLTQVESADCLGISVATARRHWVFARAWLFGQLAESTEV